MKFKYKAIEKSGKKVKGILESGNRKEALNTLKGMGLSVLEIKEVKESEIRKKGVEGFQKITGSIKKVLGRKKKQIESLKEELEYMGYDKVEINSVIKRYTLEEIDFIKLKEEFHLTEIQLDKIRSGRLNKNRKIGNVDINIKLKKEVSLDDLIAFTDHLSILLSTDIELVRSLETIQKNVKNKKLRIVIDKLIYDLTKGKDLSEAMREHPDVFSPFYISMVKVGESSGSDLPEVLSDLVKFLKMRSKIRKEFIKASIYPTFIFAFMIVILIILNYFIIPKFKKIFEEMGAELPFLSKVIFSLSEHLGFFTIMGVGILVAIIVIVTKVPYVRERFKEFIDTISLKMPVIRDAIEVALMYQLSLVVAISLRNGLSIVNALDLVNMVIGNRHVKRELGDIYYNIGKGKNLAESFKDSKYVTDTIKLAVASGETSGKLDVTLDKMAEYYGYELENRIASLTQFIVPMSILLLACVVGPFVIGMYLPMISITDQINNMNVN